MNLTVQNSNNLILEFLANFTSEATRRAYYKDLKQFFVRYNVPNGDFSYITLPMLINYRESLKAGGSSPATVNRKISTIKSLLNWAVERGALSASPAASLRLEKPSQVLPTLAFTDEEVRIIMEKTDDSYYGYLHRLMLTLLFNLGLRRSELVNIRVGDVYEDRGVKVLKVRGKGGKQRILPLTAEVYETITDYIAKYETNAQDTLYPTDYLLQSLTCEKNNQPMNPASVYRTVNRYAKEAGVTRRVGAHSCRATVISHLLENQVSPRDVADFAGHNNVNTTISIYDKKRDGLKNSAAFKVKYGT